MGNRFKWTKNEVFGVKAAVTIQLLNLIIYVFSWTCSFCLSFNFKCSLTAITITHCCFNRLVICKVIRLRCSMDFRWYLFYSLWLKVYRRIWTETVRIVFMGNIIVRFIEGNYKVWGYVYCLYTYRKPSNVEISYFDGWFSGVEIWIVSFCVFFFIYLLL